MSKPFAFPLLACALAASGGLALAFPTPQGDCDITRILPDGREVRSKGKAAGVAVSNGNSSRAAGGAASSSHSSSHSSVSVSSSSSGRGKSNARAVTSHTDAQGHQVTTVRDEAGCRITIDERD